MRIAIGLAIAIAIGIVCAPLLHFTGAPALRDVEIAARAVGRTALLSGTVAGVCALLAWPVARAVPSAVLLGWAMVGSIPRSLGVLALGMSPGWLAIAVAETSGGLPWIALLLQLRLRTIDGALFDAARNLGASAWQCWRRLEWPLARGTLGFGALWIALQTGGDTATHELAGGGKMYSAALLLRDSALVDDAPALTAALLLGLLVTAMPVTLWVARRLPDLVLAADSTPRGETRSWLGVVIAGVAIMPLVALLPQAAAPWSLGDGGIAARIDETLVVAAIVIAVALPLGAAAATGNARRGATIGAALLLPLVLPPVAYGLAGLDVARFLGVAPGVAFTVLGTLPIAVALVFVASTIARPRVPPVLVEAAANLGASPWSRLRRLWLPRMGPAWLAAALLIVAWCWSDAAIAPFTSGPGGSTVAVATTLAARGADAHAAARWAWVQITFTILAVLGAQRLWRDRSRR